MDTGISTALTPRPEAPPPRPHWLDRLALVAGLAAMAVGPLAGGVFIVLSLTGGRGADALGVTTIGVSMAALGLGAGGALAWAGYEGSRGRPSRPFRPEMRWFWRCLVGLALALLIGQLLISLDLGAPLTFPPFHVVGVALPAIAMLALVGRGMRTSTSAPTGRQVAGQLALGAFGATAIAFTLEAMVAVAGLVIGGMAMALAPGGLEQLTELQAILTDPARLQDPQTLAHWLLKPGILIPVAAMLIIVAPAIEEGAKSIGVPLLALRGKPTPAQGWLWGMAVGAGFAVAEGLFNSAANLSFWAGIALLRIGATAMHATTAGLTGLGWARTLASRRPHRLHILSLSKDRSHVPAALVQAGQALPLLGSYLASVTLHGLWNGLTVLMVISSLWAMAQPGDPTTMVMMGLSVMVGLGGLVFLTATIIGVAVYLTLRVGRG